jgi:hypothetical protein
MPGYCDLVYASDFERVQVCRTPNVFFAVAEWWVQGDRRRVSPLQTGNGSSAFNNWCIDYQLRGLGGVQISYSLLRKDSVVIHSKEAVPQIRRVIINRSVRRVANRGRQKTLPQNRRLYRLDVFSHPTTRKSCSKMGR